MRRPQPTTQALVGSRPNQSAHPPPYPQGSLIPHPKVAAGEGGWGHTGHLGALGREGHSRSHPRSQREVHGQGPRMKGLTSPDPESSARPRTGTAGAAAGVRKEGHPNSAPRQLSRMQSCAGPQSLHQSQAPTPGSVLSGPRGPQLTPAAALHRARRRRAARAGEARAGDPILARPRWPLQRLSRDYCPTPGC